MYSISGPLAAADILLVGGVASLSSLLSPFSGSDFSLVATVVGFSILGNGVACIFAVYDE